MGRITTRHIGGGHKQEVPDHRFQEGQAGGPGQGGGHRVRPEQVGQYRPHPLRGRGEEIYPRPLGAPGGRDDSGEQERRYGDQRKGTALPLKLIPLGTFVHNVEMKPGKGGQMARSAGSYAQVVAKEGDYGHLRLPSGEVKLINLVCTATIGQVGNIDHENIDWGKAGRSRWRGVRPTVRGTAMNPVDHPLGGGEGRTKGGRHPCSPWGQLAKGLKTRKNKRTDKFIVKKRG